MSLKSPLSLLSAAATAVILASVTQGASLIRNDASSLFKRQTQCTEHEGEPATFFCSGTSPTGTTACGQTYNEDAPGVAISTLLVSDSESLAQYCGMTVQLGNADTGVITSAPIIDLCATCTDSPYHIDLSLASYNTLSSTDASCSAGGELFNVNWYLQASNGVSCF